MISKQELKKYIMGYIKHETRYLNMARNKNNAYMELDQMGKIEGALAILEAYDLIDYEERLEIHTILSP